MATRSNCSNRRNRPHMVERAERRGRQPTTGFGLGHVILEVLAIHDAEECSNLTPLDLSERILDIVNRPGQGRGFVRAGEAGSIHRMGDLIIAQSRRAALCVRRGALHR